MHDEKVTADQKCYKKRTDNNFHEIDNERFWKEIQRIRKGRSGTKERVKAENGTHTCINTHTQTYTPTPFLSSFSITIPTHYLSPLTTPSLHLPHSLPCTHLRLRAFLLPNNSSVHWLLLQFLQAANFFLCLQDSHRLQ